MSNLLIKVHQLGLLVVLDVYLHVVQSRQDLVNSLLILARLFLEMGGVALLNPLLLRLSLDSIHQLGEPLRAISDGTSASCFFSDFSRETLQMFKLVLLHS